MLLDPHNLSEHQKMPTQSIAIFAILHCHLPFLANLEMIVFNIQTSYGGQKPSELNHKVNHGDKNYLSQSLGCQKELLHLHNFLPWEEGRREGCAPKALGIFSPERPVLGLRGVLIGHKHTC